MQIKSRKQFSFTQGFTILELLIVIAIISLISTVVIANYPQLRRAQAIERETQLVALALRDAEARAISTKRSPSGQFTIPFGVYFSVAQPNRYIIFNDSNADGVYTAGEELEIIQTGRYANIKRLCSGDVMPGMGDCTVQTLSVIFKRPSPTIEVRTVAGTVLSNTISNFQIDVNADDDTYKRRVTVWTTGAVGIEELP